MKLPGLPPRGVGWCCPVCVKIGVEDAGETGLYDQRPHPGRTAWKEWIAEEERLEQERVFFEDTEDKLESQQAGVETNSATLKRKRDVIEESEESDLTEVEFEEE